MRRVNLNNRLISIGIVSLLVTAGFLGFITFETEVVRAGKTVYVGTGVGNSTTSIQDAIDNYADSGDTVYVYSGIYEENLVVDKTINLTGENRETTVIDGGGSGDVDVVYVTADWVNITGFTINGSGTEHPNAGIYLDHTQNCGIVGNNISNNQFYGIYLLSSSNNMIIDNNIPWNNQGIELESYSNNNIIVGNNILSNSITLHFSSNNNISNNNISFIGTSIHLEGSDYNIFAGNNFTNEGTGPGIGIWVETSHYNNITGNCFLKGLVISLAHSSKNNIISNDLSGNWSGITLLDSSYITIMNNNFLNGGVLISAGTKLQHFNSHTISTNNRVNGKPLLYLKNVSSVPPIDGAQIGQLILANCTNIEAKNLQINNTSVGIEVAYSSDININNNKIFSNQCNGIFLWSSSNNSITDNMVSSNGYGFHLYSSSNNQIYHNNIIKNVIQAYDNMDANLWNATYPTGGNYWSDYDGVDLNSTPAQNVPPPDGIGDTPYEIDSDSQDNYPLMDPIGNYLYLREGWNLISLPYIQNKPLLSTVLKSIEGSYDTVEWYSVKDNSDHWKVYNTGKPYGNDLSMINETMGFWINITEPGGVLFEYSGIKPSIIQKITIYPGWNLVGYPSLSNKNRTAALNNIDFGTDVDSIWAWDATKQKWEEIGELDYFKVGRGYWIHANVEKVWEVPI